MEDRDGFLDAEGPFKGGESLEGADSPEVAQFPNGGEAQESGGRVMVLPVNEDSRKITQTLSNETSLKILELLGKKGMSATDIADELKIPLTTVKYNLDSLVDSDLIKVKQIKWSRKGRQVKVYEALEKLIILVPSKNPVDKLSIISLLQQYIGVIAAAFFAAAGIEYLSAYLRAKKIIDATAPLRMGVMESGNAPAPMVMGEELVSEEEEVPQNEGMGTTPKEAADTVVEEPVTEEPLAEEPLDEELFAGDVTEEPEMERVVPEEAPVEEAPEEFMEEGPVEEMVPVEEVTQEEIMEEEALEEVPVEEAAEALEVPETDGLEGMDGLPPIPPEGVTHLGGIHGLYDTLSAHPGVWFLFGCIFVVCLLVLREVYYKKKTM